MNKQIKKEIKQVVTNLGNTEFTVEDELKFCKEILKRKEQECEKLKLLNAMLNSALGYRRAGKKTFLELSVELYQLKTENEKMSKGYAELTEIVRPYIDDSTGYNEKLGGFDVVLCVKELLQQFKAK